MKAQYFIIQELVHPSYYKTFKDEAWRFIQEPIIHVIDAIRIETSSPIIINNWHKSGTYSESGLRPHSTSTGASYSIHKFGGACDLKFVDSKVTIKSVYEMILQNPKKWYDLGLRRMENIEATPTWLHVDCANTQIKDKIYVFYP